MLAINARIVKQYDVNWSLLRYFFIIFPLFRMPFYGSWRDFLSWYCSVEKVCSNKRVQIAVKHTVRVAYFDTGSQVFY